MTARHSELDIVASEALRFGVEIGSDQLDRLGSYVRELQAWNRKVNLTADKEIGDLAVRHVLDSLVLVKCVGASGRLVDVGSGAGFPGIPVKIASPETRVVLVESRRKKVSFLEHVVRTVGLRGIEVVWGRAEEALIVRLAGMEGLTLVSRAALNDEEMVDLAVSLGSVLERMILMKGRLSGGEREALCERAQEKGLWVRQISEYRLPGMVNARHLVLVEHGGNMDRKGTGEMVGDLEPR